MNKIDLHLHLTLEQLPKQNNMFISSAENMIPHLKSLGIQKGVLMSGGEKLNPVGSNDENKLICEKYPEHFSWMCNLDYSDIDTVYDRLAKYKSEGAIGIGELMINKRIDDLFLDKVFESAEKLEMPVLFHMSPEEGFSYGVVDEPGLPLLEKLLNKYPKLKVIGHSQSFWIEMSKDAPKDKEGRNSWGDGKVIDGGRIPELFSKYPNLYGDLSANSGGQAIMRDSKFGLNFLEKYSDRLFFATDMVNTDMVFPLGKWLDEQLELGNLTKETYEKICYKNAKDILGL